jgi:leucyl aminopeptidase
MGVILIKETTSSICGENHLSSSIISSSSNATPIHLVSPSHLDALKLELGGRVSAWLETKNFTAKGRQCELICDADGKLERVIFGLGKDELERLPMLHASLAQQLPAGDYQLEGEILNAKLAAIAWGLGSYQFNRYKKMRDDLPKLVLPEGLDIAEIEREIKATALVRDLINTPTNDMGPEQLEAAFIGLAEAGGAVYNVIKGDDLLSKNFPMIHAVGRASADAPRLLELNWGDENHPKLTLVGKGVCFDTGGLNIKTGNFMTLMKKDMGGAAHVMGLAQMIMDAKMPVSLQVLVPAVENAISSNAFRPGDVLQSRKGISVEISNTDAEGRLVLGDALAYGDERNPDMMIDFATLTGAARVALGPDISPFFTNDETLVADVMAASMSEHDPIWQMPLWAPYHKYLKSKVADINHAGATGFAGAVTAALFLDKFVENANSYMHLDVYGWQPDNKPWCSIGGEAFGIRAVFAMLQHRYG